MAKKLETTAGGWTAKRFTQKPLRQPTYDFRDVPKCSPDLAGSSLHFLTEREHLVEAMSEMVLLCIEAIRRHKGTGGRKRASKPLSLEYMADRLDVDDPMCGYMIRTNEKPPSGVGSDKWEMGMLQGFITITTFTNWQKSFRWDSMHDSAFAYDDEHLAEQMASGERRYDTDGSLAKALQATVRSGDPWDEGIVWPRIAEISLLGALGCGKALVSLAIEHLEHLKATGKANYDYVVLQATDNSIPFYESMGFVRVGAVTEDDKFAEKHAARVCETSSHSSDAEDVPVAVPLDESSSSDRAASPPPIFSEIVSSPTVFYTTEKPGETIKDIARRFQVDPWDTVFLNQSVYEGLTPSSRLIKGTILRIPCATAEPTQDTADEARNEHEAPLWYIARENDTPRIIAKKFNASCIELVEANKGRLPDLLAVSRLREGTRIKVSHFHIHDDMHVPYCHWTFPDDDFDSGEPSYMMVRNLNRRNSKQRAVESSLAVPISPYTPARLLMPETSTFLVNEEKLSTQEVPQAPKRPPSAFMMFVAKQRETRRQDFGRKRLSEVSKMLSAEWKLLSNEARQVFYDEFEKLRSKYQEAKDKYTKLKAEIAAADHLDADGTDGIDLFNKIVKLKPGTLRDVSEYTYWYVLTYIPDLKWCHLGPLYNYGTFGPEKPKSEGRTRWRLVDEKLGKELDISASFCIPVKSKALKRTQDADKEEWDILDPLPQSGMESSQSDRSVRTSPRRKSKLSHTVAKRIQTETVQKSLKERLVASVSAEQTTSFLNSANTKKPQQHLQKSVFSSKRAANGIQIKEFVEQDHESKVPSKLADVTTVHPRSLLLRLSMSSKDPSKKSSDLFLEEPLVAFCAGSGIDRHEPMVSKPAPLSRAKASEKSHIMVPKGVVKTSSSHPPAGDVERLDATDRRPKRKAAPHFLGESPSSADTSFKKQAPRARAAIKPLGGTIKKKAKRSLDNSTSRQVAVESSGVSAPGVNDEPLIVERPKRKAAPNFMNDQHSRKRHTFKSAGNRRSV